MARNFQYKFVHKFLVVSIELWEKRWDDTFSFELFSNLIKKSYFLCLSLQSLTFFCGQKSSKVKRLLVGLSSYYMMIMQTDVSRMRIESNTSNTTHHQLSLVHNSGGGGSPSNHARAINLFQNSRNTSTSHHKSIRWWFVLYFFYVFCLIKM